MGHPNNTGEYAKYDMPIPGPGSKPRYTDPKEMWEKGLEYIASCWEEDWRPVKDDNGVITEWKQQFDKDGNPIMKLKERPAVTKLALALGFTTRMSLMNYQKKDDFKEVIEMLKLIIEGYYETGTSAGEIYAPAGIFVLKNFGWTDTVQIKTEDTGEQLSIKEINEKIAQLQKGKE